MSFRLITYNIHKGIGGVDRRYRPQRIVDTLSHYDPDIVLLQEVDDGVPRSRKHCQVDFLGDALALEHRAFQRNVKLKQGHYGNAILSRFPLSGIHDIDLSVPLKKRRRALVAQCRLPGTRGKGLLLVTCHLGLAGFERSMQLRMLLGSPAIARAHGRQSVVVGGDYNDVWNTLGRRFMEPAGFDCASNKARTFPAIMPVRCLDHIFFRGNLERTHAFASHRKISKQASDHLPLIADFQVS